MSESVPGCPSVHGLGEGVVVYGNRVADHGSTSGSRIDLRRSAEIAGLYVLSSIMKRGAWRGVSPGYVREHCVGSMKFVGDFLISPLA